MPWGVDEFRAVTDVARERGVRVHLDGARLFNACAATGAKATDYTGNVDTVMFCLSKGLGRADRLDGVRDEGLHPRGEADAHPDRRRVAPGRHHGGRGTDRAARRPGPAARGPREREAPGRGHRGGDARRDRPGDGADEHPVPGHAARRHQRPGGARPPARRRRPVERAGHEGPPGDQPGRRARRTSRTRSRCGARSPRTRGRAAGEHVRHQVPARGRGARPSGTAPGQDVADPALRRRAAVRRGEVGLPGDRPGREPVHTVVRGAESARPADRPRGHALRDRAGRRSTTTGRASRSASWRRRRSRSPRPHG